MKRFVNYSEIDLTFATDVTSLSADWPLIKNALFDFSPKETILVSNKTITESKDKPNVESSLDIDFTPLLV